MSRGVSFSYTHRIFFEILLNQTEISLFLPFFRLIWNSKQMSVCCPINWKMVNTIWFGFDIIRFWKYISVRTRIAHSRTTSWQIFDGKKSTDFDAKSALPLKERFSVGFNKILKRFLCVYLGCLVLIISYEFEKYSVSAWWRFLFFHRNKSIFH